MSDVAFVDANLLIYAHDRDSAIKRDRSIRLLEGLWEAGTGRLSAQVLQEFYVNVTQKLATPVERSLAREVIETYAAWVREPTTPETILRAAQLADLAHLSFWDALIVASAEQAGATRLYSEDFQSGRLIAGIRIMNPLIE